jgi:hypothetical protein
MLPASNFFAMKFVCQTKDMHHRLRVAFTVDFPDSVLQQCTDSSKDGSREAVQELAGEICTDLTAVARRCDRVPVPGRVFRPSTVVKVHTKDGKEKHSTLEVVARQLLREGFGYLRIVDNEHEDPSRRELSLPFELELEDTSSHPIECSPADGSFVEQAATARKRALASPASEIGQQHRGGPHVTTAGTTKKQKSATQWSSGESDKPKRDRGGPVLFMRQYLGAALPRLNETGAASEKVTLAFRRLVAAARGVGRLKSETGKNLYKAVLDGASPCLVTRAMANSALDQLRGQTGCKIRKVCTAWTNC